MVARCALRVSGGPYLEAGPGERASEQAIDTLSVVCYVYMCLFLVCGIGWSVWFCSQRLGSNGRPRGSGPAEMQVCGAAEDHKSLCADSTLQPRNRGSCMWLVVGSPTRTGRPVGRTPRRSCHACVDSRGWNSSEVARDVVAVSQLVRSGPQPA